MQIIPVIEVRDDERRIEVAETFIMLEDYNAYVEDVQVCDNIYVRYCGSYVVNGT